MDSRLNEYILSKKEAFASDLGRLVAVYSVRSAPTGSFPFGEGPAKALDTAAEILSEHGFEMENLGYYAGETNLGNNPDTMLLSHLDVVPAGDGWTRPYDRMTREGDTVYGRGVTDDKGAFLACVYAMEAVRELYGEPATGARLVCGCAEETGSEDMEYYFSKRPYLKNTYSPDAEYPLINVEKGRHAPVFSFEPGGFTAIKAIKGGETSNIIPGKASAVLSGISESEVREKAETAARETGAEFEITAEDLITVTCCGRGAHASTPECGNNANTALTVFLCRVLPVTDALYPALSALGRYLPHGVTDGSPFGIDRSDDVSGALTFANGILSFDGKTLKAGFDLRVPAALTEENTADVIYSAMTSCGFTGEKAPMVPAHIADADSAAVKTALSVYEEYTGNKGECIAIGGGTYVHGIPGGVAFGIEFPGKDYSIHSADETADLNELLLTACMYAEIIRRLCY